jgi:hypothetical protein
MAETAEFFDVSIAYVVPLERMLQHIGVKLRVMARPWYRSDVDNSINAMPT